jgi:hypothetical protein
VQTAAGRGAGSGDIAGVHRNFRLHQHDIQHGITTHPPSTAAIVLQNRKDFNINVAKSPATSNFIWGHIQRGFFALSTLLSQKDMVL